MAGNRFFGFPSEFFRNREDTTTEVIYGNMHPDFHDVYASTVLNSHRYARMNDLEKLFIADEFMEIFYYGGQSLADQRAWFTLIGYSQHDFEWDEYRTIYESL